MRYRVLQSLDCHRWQDTDIYGEWEHVLQMANTAKGLHPDITYFIMPA